MLEKANTKDINKKDAGQAGELGGQDWCAMRQNAKCALETKIALIKMDVSVFNDKLEELETIKALINWENLQPAQEQILLRLISNLSV